MNFFKKDREPTHKSITLTQAQDLIVQKVVIDQQADRINQKYEFPASFKKARVHQKAVKFGYNASRVFNEGGSPSGINTPTDSSKPVYERPKVCPCCSQPINTQSISIFYDTTDVNDEKKPFLLNSSSSMFFSFIKMAILYLVMVFIICGAFNLATSFDGNYCNKNKAICTQSIFELISTYNKHEDQRQKLMLRIQNILCLVAVVGSIIYFIIYRKIQYNIYAAIDAEHQTQDDYTLFIQNIPVLDFRPQMNTNDMEMIAFNYEQKLKQMFESEIQTWIEWMRDQNPSANTIEKNLVQTLNSQGKTIQDIEQGKKVTTISLCFDLGELQKINKERQGLMDQHINAYQQDESAGLNEYDIKNQISALNNIQLNLCQKFAQDNSATFNITHFVGKGFISFEYQHFREYIMQKYEDKSKVFKYGDNVLTLSRASHPTDVNWFNMKISDEQRLRKVVTSYLIIFMILVFSAAALIGIDFIKLKGIKQGKVTQPESIIINYGLSIIASALAYVINIGIGYVIIWLTDYEKHQTVTNKFSSQIIKTLIAQFINTAFIFYLIQLFNHRPYLSSAGLVVQVSFLIVVSGFISILMNALNHSYWIRYAKLWYKYNYTTYKAKVGTTVPTYQVRLNKDFEYPVFDIAGRYSKYLLQVYMCMFYCYLVPVGVVATAAILGIQFWMDKAKMFKSSSEYNELGYFLSRVILKMFEGSLLIFTVGNLIFGSAIYGEYHVDILNIIAGGIALLYVCFIAFAPASLQRKVFAKYETFQPHSYSDCINRHQFTENYWTQNPATVFAKQVDINDNENFIQQIIGHEVYCIDDIKNDSNMNEQWDQNVNANQQEVYQEQYY